MKERIKHFIVAGILALTMGAGVLLPAGGAAALSPAEQANNGLTAAGGNNDKTCGPNGNAQCTLGDRIAQVINVLLFLIGAVSVIMIIIGGIRYVLSNGDSTQITGAKNTILYAVIGLVVALLAYAIVNFVVTQFAA
jgi:hypothetical protein